MTLRTHHPPGVARRYGALLALCLLTFALPAQEAPPAQSSSAESAQTKSADTPAPNHAPPQSPPDQRPKFLVTDAERSAVEITALTLDLHLEPADAREEAHATLTVRNVSAAPLARIPLQLSSSLRWQSVSARSRSTLRPVPFTQAPIATDTDHTGYAQEAVLTLPEPLAPGASLYLEAFYAGQILASSARMDLLGGTPSERAAAAANWDAIAPTSDASSTALRGFGNVLWYPVAAATAALGDGNKLSQLLSLERSKNIAVTMRLRLTVVYVGDPPDAAIFNGRKQPLTRTSDSSDQLIDETHGIATTDFAESPIGPRLPSLFLTAQHAVATPDQLLSLITPSPEAGQPYITAAAAVRPLLTSWFGPAPSEPLLLLDHAGESFEEGALLVAPFYPAAAPEETATKLVRGLSSAWLGERLRFSGRGGQWLDQGLPEFMTLLWTEQTQGREAALARLGHTALLLALAEPDLSATPSALGQPLPSATTDVYLRLKSAAVLWQLREILGSSLLEQAVTDFRHTLSLSPALDPTRAFERAAEKAAGKDLQWFFDDWVHHDRGLPDLSIVQVNPRLLPARPGKDAGYLVSIEVHNDGDAVAEVPVTIRSGDLFSTERLRIPARSSASTRILFEGSPELVVVNDGSVPELRVSRHTSRFGTHP